MPQPRYIKNDKLPQKDKFLTYAEYEEDLKKRQERMKLKYNKEL